MYNQNNPYLASITENRLLTKSGSKKETRHLVVDFSGMNESYECGDSLGIIPSNREEDVNHLLEVIEASGEEMVKVPKVEEEIKLREALTNHLYFLAGPTKKFLKSLYERVTSKGERMQLQYWLEEASKEAFNDYLYKHHYVDFLEMYTTAKYTPQELVGFFKRLTARLYSIASGPSLYPEQAHLLIAAVRYEMKGRGRIGVGSTYSIDRVPLNKRVVPVFIARSHFGLPKDDETDIIMIGPGTGLAPFRSFLQERESRGAKGRNWLFFGEQHEATDFLYRDEILAWKESGHLDRLDLAWSRDQGKKVYVQHKIEENREAFWEWVDRGAVIYVCGDKARMAADVEREIVHLAIENGVVENDPAAVKAWIREMKKERRYQLDVY